MENKNEIENLIIPNGVKHVKDNEYENLDNITNVKFPQSLESIGNESFFKCKNIKEISIPANCKIIGQGAFHKAINLENVVFEGDVDTIMESAFQGCTSLRTVTLKKLRVLESSAFSSNTKLKAIELPEGLIEIGSHAFDNCFNLSTVKLPSTIKSIPDSCFYNCTILKSIDFPDTLNRISDNAFSNCSYLNKIKCPKYLFTIGQNAFSNCYGLTNVEFNNNLVCINNSAFSECLYLDNLVIPDSVVVIGRKAFYNCGSLTSIKLPKKLDVIKERLFSNCDKLEDIILPENLKEIHEFAFNHCTNLKRLDLSQVESISTCAFNECINLEEVIFSPKLTNVESDIFKYCRFKYIYKLKDSNKIVLSTSKPQFGKGVDEIYSIDEINSHIEHFDISKIITNKTFDEFNDIFKTLKKEKIKISDKFYDELLRINKLNYFIKNSTFKFFNNELSKSALNEIDDLSKDNKFAFLKFANSLGCFSKEKILDKNGNPTDACVGQKASSFLGAILKNEKYDLSQILITFYNLPFETKTDQNFLNFISKRGADKNFDNFDMLLNLENSYKDMSIKVMNGFKNVKKFSKGIDDDGLPFDRNIEETLIAFYEQIKYLNLNESNMKLVDVLNSTGVKQKEFDLASYYYESAKENNIPNHILGTPLKEKTIAESIEEIMGETNLLINDSKEIIDKLMDKGFTYEMLDKSAPENAVIGVYCSCCATLNNTFYGKYILKASIVEKDVQNLVIRDQWGEIIAKGTLYVNEKFGYGIFNDFELNEEYKVHEILNGNYEIHENSEADLNREKIFNAFMRGINAFAQKYDEIHPDKPIQQINVGLGCNRLSDLCKRYPKEKKLLQVPMDYSFFDTNKEQIILYKKDTPELLNNQGGI